MRHIFQIFKFIYGTVNKVLKLKRQKDKINSNYEIPTNLRSMSVFPHELTISVSAGVLVTEHLVWFAWKLPWMLKCYFGRTFLSHKLLHSLYSRNNTILLHRKRPHLGHILQLAVVTIDFETIQYPIKLREISYPRREEV